MEPILRALAEEGYQKPTPIQQQAILPILEGRDLLGVAQTGTGKTAAFTIPVLQRMQQEQAGKKSGRRPISALILTPTRELAIQIGDSILAYGRHLHLNSQVIFGGVSQVPQVQSLQRGVDILVATPGRLLDLMQQGYVGLSHIRYFILDEADRMLDMGFVHDVKRVIAQLPDQRQTLFFSATMPKEIQELARILLTNPVKVEVTPVSSTAERVSQTLYYVSKPNKISLLLHLLQDPAIKNVLVFTQMKHAADKLAKQLSRSGILADAIHGNKSQNARQRALEHFKTGQIRVLVATDIAARGIDIDELSHVLNFDLPNVAETYVHRIGRTGRAGFSGSAISFCDLSEQPFLSDIQKLTRQTIPVIEEHPFPLTAADWEQPVAPPVQSRNQGNARNSRRPGQPQRKHGVGDRGQQKTGRSPRH